MKPPRYWRKLEECPAMFMSGHSEVVIQEIMRLYSLDREAALARLAKHDAACKWYVNDLYQIEVKEMTHGFLHLNIRRRDGGVIHDWRHLQQIKNELVGEECEAIELYPAESRLVDTTNKYHLWACTDPTFRFPVGFEERDVQDDQGETKPGLRQRAF